MASLWTIEELIRELDQPNLNGWKLFAQTSDVKVYRQADENTVKYFNESDDFFAMNIFRN
jgi:hypothetical protein